MKDVTGTPFIELSEKLAKAEAERDVALRRAEDANRLAGSRSLALEAAECVGVNLKARAEAAEAAIEKAKQSEYAASLDAENAKLALATARAVAMEEAARDVMKGGSGVDAMAARLRAIAPLPAGLVVVPVEVLERIELAAEILRRPKHPTAYREAALSNLDAALEALTKERKP